MPLLLLKPLGQVSRCITNMSCRACTVPLGSHSLSASFSSIAISNSVFLTASTFTWGIAATSPISLRDQVHYTISHYPNSPSPPHLGLVSSLQQTGLCLSLPTLLVPFISKLHPHLVPGSQASGRRKKMAKSAGGGRGNPQIAAWTNGQTWRVEVSTPGQEKCEVLP